MKTKTVSAWICPKCGTTHPITVTKCCGPSPRDTWKPVDPPRPIIVPEPSPQIVPQWPKQDQGCMHDNCPGCQNGTCSGIHMISCPCPKCSPTC